MCNEVIKSNLSPVGVVNIKDETDLNQTLLNDERRCDRKVVEINSSVCISEGCNNKVSIELLVVNGRSKCNVCEGSNASVTEYLDSVMQTYCCRECNLAFKLSCEIEEHIFNAHLKGQGHTFNGYVKDLSRSGLIKNYILKPTDLKHSVKPFLCSNCGKAFKSLFPLKIHLQSHTSGPFRCYYCNETFKQSDHFQLHLQLHTGERPFKCSLCYKTFKVATQFKKHLIDHTGEKMYKCSFCCKEFKESMQLKFHLKFHAEERSYKCSQCSKIFKRSHTLKSHMFLRHHLLS